MTTQDRPRSPVRSSDTDLLRLLTGAVEKLRNIPDKLDSLSCICDVLRQFTVWRGEWTDTVSYQARDQVRSQGWLAIANKDNPSGSPIPTLGTDGWLFDLVGTPPAWTRQTIAEPSYLTGQEYAFEGGGLVSSSAVTTPANSSNFTFELWVRSNPGLPNESVTQVAIIPGTATETRHEHPISAQFLSPGEILQVFLLARANTLTSSFSSTWSVKNQNGSPDSDSGEAWFQSNQTEIRVSHEDKNSTDQQANLESVEPGGTLAFGGSTWTVTDVDPRGGHVRYTITPAQGRPGEADRVMTWEWGSTDPIPYLEQSSYWGAYPLVTGLAGPSLDNLTRSQNAYAVDIYVAEMIPNPDWDLQAYSD